MIIHDVSFLLLSYRMMKCCLFNWACLRFVVFCGIQLDLLVVLFYIGIRIYVDGYVASAKAYLFSYSKAS